MGLLAVTALVLAGCPTAVKFDNDAGQPVTVHDGGLDAGVIPHDAGIDAGQPDAEVDGGFDAGEPDAGVDGGLETPDSGPMDSGFDGGPVEDEDAGDGGGPVVTPDGGVCQGYDVAYDGGFAFNAPVGSFCDLHHSTGSCAAGLDCVVIPPATTGLCSIRNCSVGPACADETSWCVGGTPTLCLPGCAPGLDCPDNNVCVEGKACLPDCRKEVPTYCAVQFGADKTCDQGSGICQKKACSHDSDCGQGSGQICDTNLHACITDCRAVPSFCCNLGQTCNTGTGHCSPGPPYTGSFQLDLSVVPVPDAGIPDAGVVIDCGTQCGVDGGSDDAGVFVDAGQCEAYVGPSEPDGGAPANGGIGSVCSGGDYTATSQGTCQNGLKCLHLALSSASVCVQLGCQHDSDCGLTGTNQNRCVFLGSSIPQQGCVIGCDSTHACPANSGLACDNVAGVATLCVPDCRNQWDNYCPSLAPNGEIGATCNQTSGKCESLSCSATCPSGSVCDHTNNTCTPDCRRENLQFCCGGMGGGRGCGDDGVCQLPPMNP